jgi:alpha-galactosidase/6-phospho-beta-glucosidase family protein
MKISIIGAGSAVFSLSMIRDLCLTSGIKGSLVNLMDINPHRLDAVFNLCRRYAVEVGADLRLEKTLDRRKSLEGADFVVNAALTAGHDRLKDGWEIGAKNGYRFGGSLHFMHDEAFWINYHQLSFFEDLIQDILDVCPNAWYIKVANPVLAGMTLLTRKYPQVKMVGLCHGFRGVYHLANILGFDENHITFEIPGVNHFVWLTSLFHNGEDALPLLESWIEEKSSSYFKDCGMSSDVGPKAVDIYRRFGAFPIGDTCTVGGGAWGWWYHTDDQAELNWQEDPQKWWKTHFSNVDRNISEINRVATDSYIKVTDVFPPQKSGELVVQIIESISRDIPRVLTVNIANQGSVVPGVPQNFAVELPALVSARGIQGIHTHPLPPLVQAHLWKDRLAPVEIELQAYETGSRDLLKELIVMDPWTKNFAQADRVVEEIFTLPYHQDMRDHYNNGE